MSQKSSHNHKNMLSGIALMLILCAALASALLLLPVQTVPASSTGNDTDLFKSARETGKTSSLLHP